MSETIRQFVWFGIVACIVAYAVFLVAGSAMEVSAAAYSPTLIRDNISVGEHQLSGMIMVPLTCDDLSVNSSALGNNTYTITFSTWQEPSVNCKQDATPRAFHAVIFAPSVGVTFTATLDGQSIPIAVIPVVSADASPAAN